MDFNTWLDTFIEEKGIDLEDTFEFETPRGWNLMPYGVVIELAKQADEKGQKGFKDCVVAIDYKNGDVLDFFRFLGTMHGSKEVS